MTPRLSLKRMEEYCAKATRPPWHLNEAKDLITQTAHITRDVWTIPHVVEDMDFIANARTDLPALISWAKRARAHIEKIDLPDCCPECDEGRKLLEECGE